MDRPNRILCSACIYVYIYVFDDLSILLQLSLYYWSTPSLASASALSTAMTFLLSFTKCLLFGAFLSVSSALPDGFVDEGVTSIDGIITGAFAPNPRNGNKPMLLLSSKSGQIFAVEDPDDSEDFVTVGDFSNILCTNGERGLQSITPHPNFTDNRYIYLFYSSLVDECPESADTGPPTRVSRYIMDPDTLRIDVDSEFRILETSPSPKKVHNGGTMAFGVDGFLYITTGDGGMREPAYSQDLTNLYGSILRVDVNGDAPQSNPFTTASGGTGVSCGKSGTGRPPVGSPANAVCEEIYAYGLRNPFRLTMDRDSTERVLYAIGDVGASVWEEISFGGADFAGANYGWPTFEGPCIRGSQDVDCLIPTDDESYIEPHHYYTHTSLEEGGAVVGSAFVPANSGWPEKYQYLFIDFIFNTTYNLIEAPDEECRECKPPIPGYINETFYEREIMIDLFFGPYKDVQALYVISRGAGQSIRRIRYTGSGNKAPVANFTVSATLAKINQVLVFDGRSSFDDDGDEISFQWDFGDGVTSTRPIANHTYTEFGQYTVKLTVTDILGQTNQGQTVIKVGTPPIAQMHSPKLDSRFAVGQEMTVFGNATNALGVLLNDTQISWEVRQHHAQHYHPFLDRQAGVGNGFKLDPAPSPEDFLAAENSYLEIIMYATDSFGLVSNVTRDIYPKKVVVTIDSTPRGLEVFVDEFPVTTPKNITSWENHKLRLNVLDQKNLTFASWSIGGSRKTNFTVPARNVTVPIISVALMQNGTTTAPKRAPTMAPIRAPTKAPIIPTKQPTRKPTQNPVKRFFPTDAPSSWWVTETDSQPSSSEAPVSSPMDNSVGFSDSSAATWSRQDLFLVEWCVLFLFTYVLQH